MKQHTVYDRTRLPDRTQDPVSRSNVHGGLGRTRFSATEFSIVRNLAVLPDSDIDQLSEAVGHKPSTLLEALGRLWQGYVIDCVTFLEGNRVKTVFNLTPEGREEFLHQLASLYEIPE